jgi:TRAP-type C4-dicarboxylate transport system substrate-binding protein
MELEEITGAVGQGAIAGGESTYPRFYALNQNEVCEVINDTAHSLFLTSIIVSTKFWDGLSGELQTIVSEAALNAARFERKESVDDIEAVQRRCADDGIKIVTLPEEEVRKFKEAVQPVYAKYRPVFGDLVDRIRNA